MNFFKSIVQRFGPQISEHYIYHQHSVLPLLLEGMGDGGWGMGGWGAENLSMLAKRGGLALFELQIEYNRENFLKIPYALCKHEILEKGKCH